MKRKCDNKKCNNTDDGTVPGICKKCGGVMLVTPKKEEKVSK